MKKTEAEIIKGFKENVEYFHSLRSCHKKHGDVAIETEVLNLISQNISENIKILDAGCGEGSVTNYFAKRFPNAEFFGIDISDIGISLVIEEAKKSEISNALLQVGNLKNINFSVNFFDLIYSQSVIEHIVNYEDALKEFKRVLKPGGKLIIRVSNGGVEGKKLQGNN